MARQDQDLRASGVPLLVVVVDASSKAGGKVHTQNSTTVCGKVGRSNGGGVKAAPLCQILFIQFFSSLKNLSNTFYIEKLEKVSKFKFAIVL